MARTTIRCRVGFARAVGVGVAALVLSLAWVQAPASAQEAPFNETAAAQLANLKPEQRERLVQIQLQAQGPLAFSLRERNESSAIGDRGRFIGPPLSGLPRTPLSEGVRRQWLVTVENERPDASTTRPAIA